MDNIIESNDQVEVRIKKIDAIKEMGLNPYPNDRHPDSHSQTIISKFEQYSKEELDENISSVKIAGRVMTIRGQGKAGFATIKDKLGEIQIYVNGKNVSELDFDLWKKLDSGDIVYVEGEVFKTKVGAISVRARQFTILAKSMRPLPEKFHGLTDVEERYRRRYLDLIVNDESKQTLINRSIIISKMREFLNKRGYLEVETPVLQTLAGGAAARPFTTHHNTLDIPMFMRIAPELYLKQLIVGGLDRVYEIGKQFRNEGISIKHNPEFTTLELYEAFGDMYSMMEITEDLFKYLAMEINNTLQIQYEDLEIDLENFSKIHMVDIVAKYTGVNFFDIYDLDVAKTAAKENNIKLEDHHNTVGHILNEFFEQVCEEKLVQPTFIYGHPTEISPLSRLNDEDERFTDRFELFIGGREYANAFSELNDPREQLRRFVQQDEERGNGNDEAHAIDYDFIRALEYALPPTGGLGVGVDRMIMLLTNSSSIRDVIFFPTMKKINK